MTCWGGESEEYYSWSDPGFIRDHGQPFSGTYSAVTVNGPDEACALGMDDQLVECWSRNRSYGTGQLQADFEGGGIEVGPFKSIGDGCGIRPDGSVGCWTIALDMPGAVSGLTALGTFSALGDRCGIRTDQTLACWSYDWESLESAPDGSGLVVLDTEIPGGTFTEFSQGANHSCGLRTSGAVACWGNNWMGSTDAPAGTFTTVSVSGASSCALRVDGTAVCWGPAIARTSDIPDESYKSIVTGGGFACAVRTSGEIDCWGPIPLPTGVTWQ